MSAIGRESERRRRRAQGREAVFFIDRERVREHTPVVWSCAEIRVYRERTGRCCWMGLGIEGEIEEEKEG